MAHRGRRRAAVAVIAALLLTGCTAQSGGTPVASTALQNSTAPQAASPAASSPASPSSRTELPDPPATDPPLSDPSSAVPSTAAAGTESMVWVPAGDHRVPGTLAMPATTAGGQVPAVLLLHGDLSSRDENDDMFGRLADALSARGIASLRIDFAGSGDSEEPDLDLSYPNMVDDATAALNYLAQDAAVDPARIAVLGLSRGGSIAATVAGTVPGVAALVSWSGAVSNGVDEDPDAHQEAAENGWVTVDLGDREFRLSVSWFDTIAESHPLDDVVGYRGPVLAVVGSDDDIVPPEVSETFIEDSESPDKTLHVIDGADHGFTAEQAYGDEAIAVTADWLTARLVS